MKKIFLLLITAAAFTSCSEEFITSDLQNIVTDETIAELSAESPEALLNIASSFDAGTINNLRTYGVGGTTGHNDYGQKSIDLMMDIMSNDMETLESNTGWYMTLYNYTGRVQNLNATSVIWNYYYEIIKGANQTIGLIGNVPEESLTDDLKYVFSRAKAIRGYAYLYLIQIYQKGQPALTDLGVPIIDPTADVLNGPGFGRLTVQDVYNQIETDLTEAFDGLDGYARPDKTAVNQEVVAALLAKFYLVWGTIDNSKYQKAIDNAIIAQGAGSLSGSDLLDGFQFIYNPEVIWGADLNVDTNSYYASFISQMQSFSAQNQSNYGTTLGYPGQLAHHRTIDPRLYAEIKSTDIRSNWFGPDNGYIKAGQADQFYNYKYYDNTDFEADYIYMRVAEYYLIEAEAKAEMGDDAGAAQALYNLMTTRDSSYTLSTNTGQDLIDEIRLNRRIELWGEGFGLLDMKRWGVGLTRDYVGSTHPQNSGFFNLPAGSNSFTFQLPEDEITLNDAITTADQNPN
ncbi:RagB/SusD family nutrient uptake outer membrane protein [Aureibaculum sp. A20]|uniref:RagB/SusD family nutrient uptake outer membrane protein n=1 Tax=Aureibaculum flavum TaxID=2795986 RepID=A0ABS0WSS8_9FLAO|nr:RagB/SusD family nutrient uptake outer membrane protein [Aureibaculum flavum]MBJ2175036.1 RagB/SusD family nutrient uptake outer membrane protein [Aureibaculum flavum]